MTRSGGFPWLIIAIVVFGALLRLHALLADARFHPDEAYFTGFARRAAIYGDWMLLGDLDKPPLALYASALALTLFAVTPNADGVLDLKMRQGEIAARFPSTAAGILIIGLIYFTARSSGWPRGTGTWAALLAATSPLAIAFSAAAFTDGLMLLFITAALASARANRAALTALALALAVLCKFQAAYAAPLILWIGSAPGGSVDWPQRALRSAAAAIAGVLGGLIAIVIWDALRQPGVPLLVLAAQHNDPARLIRPDEVVPRFTLWLEQGRALFGSTTVIVIAGAVVIGLDAWRSRLHRDAWLRLGLLIWMLTYLLIHWLVAFNIYDRYLLPVLPALCLLGGRGLAALQSWLRRHLPAAEAAAASGIVGLMMMLSGLAAARWELPGTTPSSSFERAAGIDALAAFIDAQPLGTIVYDVWLGWELSYYLDAWSDKRRVYHPTPGALLADALAQPDRAPRLFVAPDSRPLAVWLDPLRDHGFTVTLVFESAQYVAYSLVPP